MAADEISLGAAVVAVLSAPDAIFTLKEMSRRAPDKHCFNLISTGFGNWFVHHHKAGQLATGRDASLDFAQEAEQISLVSLFVTDRQLAQKHRRFFLPFPNTFRGTYLINPKELGKRSMRRARL